MHADTDADILRLQTALRDLVALSAIPAAWTGRQPPAVAAGLADALIALLQLDFVFVRLCYPDGAGAADVTRGSAWKRFPEWLDDHAATRVRFPGKAIVADVGDGSPSRGVAISIGVNGDGGLIAAASERSDFPSAVEQMLLSLAANQAATAFQNACLIDERRRAEEEVRAARDELEVKVAERTAELHVANEELSALRRMATLVARGVPPTEIFSAVSDEVDGLFGSSSAVLRFDHDRPASVFVGVSKSIDIAIGTRWEFSDGMASAEVYSTGRSARVDAMDWSSASGPVAETARRLGIVSTVVSPIVVDGRLWGAMSVSSSDELLPVDTEARLEEFTELVATAIANADSREALARLAGEQAALRRVATLVARGVRPVEIFVAVGEEVSRLLGADQAVVGRFDADGQAIVLVGVGPTVERWELKDFLASADVFRTGRSARADAKDWVSAGGPVADRLRSLGLVSTVASPIVVEGRLWGAIIVATEDEPLPLDAEQRLEKFTELVATAISNAESKSELAASRMRIVAATDDARRRIERNLHDGAQQRLVSLGLELGAVEAMLPDEQAGVRSELGRLVRELEEVLEDLRETSRGIHPAILSEGGLEPALRALGRRSSLLVEMDVRIDRRLPEPIEVGTYYVVSEALTNVAKHSQTSAAYVDAELRDGTLHVSIHDDGVGGADPASGSGLLGLRDRAEALGGALELTSSPGRGTSIVLRVPIALD